MIPTPTSASRTTTCRSDIPLWYNGGMKKCIGCGVAKNRSEFYANPGTADGLLGKCKPCILAAMQRDRELNPQKYIDRDRARNRLPHRIAERKRYAKTEGGKQARRNASNNYYRRNSHKRKAVIAANNAVRDGRLMKRPCDVCGVAKVEAHHADYSKPLEVRWLCNKHHREEHKR